MLLDLKDIMKVTNRGACISRYSCNVTYRCVSTNGRANACISRYSCNVTSTLTSTPNVFSPALAGIRVMLPTLTAAQFLF